MKRISNRKIKDRNGWYYYYWEMLRVLPNGQTVGYEVCISPGWSRSRAAYQIRYARRVFQKHIRGLNNA